MRPRPGAIGSGLIGIVVILSACTPQEVPPEEADDARGPLAAQTPAQTPTASAHVLIEDRAYVFPVDGDASYGAEHHDYPATDIFATCGTPVLAPVSGIVSGVSRTDRHAAAPHDPTARGGLSWTLVGDDGLRYYGSHLSALARSLEPGTWVHVGQRIGRVGESGNAAGTGCHLHFGISPVCGRNDDWWVRRGVVTPYPYLQAWEQERHRPPVREVTRWRRANGCPSEPPG